MPGNSAKKNLHITHGRRLSLPIFHQKRKERINISQDLQTCILVSRPAKSRSANADIDNHLHIRVVS